MFGGSKIVRLLPKIWLFLGKKYCAPFCALFGQIRCAFEFRIIKHSARSTGSLLSLPCFYVYIIDVSEICQEKYSWNHLKPTKSSIMLLLKDELQVRTDIKCFWNDFQKNLWQYYHYNSISDVSSVYRKSQKHEARKYVGISWNSNLTLPCENRCHLYLNVKLLIWSMSSTY